MLPLLGLLALAISSAFAQKKPPQPDLRQHYDAARTFALSGDQERAAAEYKAFLADVLRQIANLRTRERDYASALPLFAQAIEIASEIASVRQDYASALLSSGDLDAAKVQAEQAVRLAPKDSRTEYLLGRVLFEQGDWKGAKEHFEAAAKMMGGDLTFDVGYHLALAYLKVEDVNRASVVFDEMMLGLGNTAQLHLYFGHAYLMSGFHDRAITEFKRALEKDPKIKQAHYFLGLAYLSRDEGNGFEENAAEDRAEIALNPGDFRPHYDLGNIALKLHREEEAEKELKRATEIEPANPDPWINLGELSISQRRLPEAEAQMRKAIAVTKDVAHNHYQVNRAYYVLGRILVETGRREEGAQALKTSAELRERGQVPLDRSGSAGSESLAREKEMHGDEQGPVIPAEEQRQLEAYFNQFKPAIADAFNNLGVAAASRKDYGVAAGYFRRAGEWYPEIETLDRNLGMAQFYAGHYSEAIPPLYHQLERNPADTRVRAALGLSYFAAENYAAVLETLKLMKDEVNTDPGLALAYSVSLAKTGKYDEGMARMRALAQADPDLAGVHAAIGEAYADQKLYGTAIEEYRKALAIDPNQGRTHFLLGLSLMHEATEADAAQEFRAAVTLDPGDATAKYHLAYALIQMQKKDEGQALLREVVVQNPAYADAFYQLGKLQLEQGDTKAAISNLETSARLSPASDYIHYQLAMAYRRDSRTEEAEREMQKYEAMKQHRRGEHEPPPSN
jgi:tetratricopeptide (TPR) repeat protein